MPKLDLGLPSYDSLFSTEEERQEANTEKVMTIPINKIKDFEGHPFHVTMDEDMAKLIDSIKENDMLMPALVRPKPDGTYEMISGHRRKFAMSQLGKTEMNVIIRDLDDDHATILMVDSNIQRENIYPSERGYAYKMRLEAMKHQGKKVDINVDDVHVEYDKTTSNQVGWKLESAHEVGQQAGDSGTQVRRYVRLNSLVPDLQKKVDSGTLKFNPAVELSYLTPDEQQSFLDYAEAQDCTPSLSQAQKLKAASKEGTLTPDKLEEIMSAQKPSVAPREPVLNINVSKVAQYFPTGCTKQQMENRILKILDSYFRQMAHEQAHEEER